MLYPATISPLKTSFTQESAGFIQPEHLYVAAGIFFVFTLLIVAATFWTQHLKKKNHDFKESIRQSLEEWITEAVLSQTTTEFGVPEKLSSVFKKPDARQLLIDELVRSKSSFLGSISDNLVKLYYQLGLNVDSRSKLDQKETHIQCKGIHELCVMEQKDDSKKVYHLTNSEDKDVRIEAQTAILQWYGFKGLRFLDVVSYPITEFQQLKLLELLRQIPFTEVPKLQNWLASNNDTVVNFALKLAEHYKQKQVLHQVEQCLYHKSEEVRVQAVKTIVAIADSSTANLLTKVYETERFTNRLNILRYLPRIAGDEQRDFLIIQLHEGHEYLRLAAAKVLAGNTTDGMEILEAKSFDDPAVYRNIYLHVKSAVGL